MDTHLCACRGKLFPVQWCMEPSSDHIVSTQLTLVDDFIASLTYFYNKNGSPKKE